jgi:putative GTP pyrophosphokinase
MKVRIVPKKIAKEIDSLVVHYSENRSLFVNLIDSLNSAISNSELHNIIHSIKSRTKDPEHLRDKLNRKYLEKAEKGQLFGITKENLFSIINDLAGCRILHLHTKQIEKIDQHLKLIFDAYSYNLVEGPFARTWDDESRDYFTNIGMRVESSSTMYTSVHYILAANTKKQATCELQVRTLMEEVWGEVDHKINYPYPLASTACKEQIKVLARVTSGCSRLVDSIFLSQSEHNKLQPNKRPIGRKKPT